jgi:hypothetical protein
MKHAYLEIKVKLPLDPNLTTPSENEDDDMDEETRLMWRAYDKLNVLIKKEFADDCFIYDLDESVIE